jgi:hypothetical protein
MAVAREKSPRRLLKLRHVPVLDLTIAVRTVPS